MSLLVKTGSGTIPAELTLAVTFDTAFPDGTDYIVFANCYDNFGRVQYSITAQDEAGFTVEALGEGTFEWRAIEIGASTVPSHQISGLRNDTGRNSVVTAGTLITFGVPYPVGSTYNIFANCYDDSGDVGYNITTQTEYGFTVVPLRDSTFEWEAAQVGEYETAEITPSGRLSRDWKAGDFWMEAVRDIGVDVPPLFHFERFNLIDRAVQAVAGQVYGLYGNDYMTDQEVTITDDQISLTTLRIMRGGQQARLSISSTAGYFFPVSEIEYNKFRSTSQNNKGLYRYTFGGETIKFQKHSDSADYGNNIIVSYPRTPLKALTDTQYLDLPDGLPIFIALYALKCILVERYGKDKEKDKGLYVKQMETLLARLFQQYGVALDLSEVQQKAKALI